MQLRNCHENCHENRHETHILKCHMYQLLLHGCHEAALEENDAMQTGFGPRIAIANLSDHVSLFYLLPTCQWSI